MTEVVKLDFSDQNKMVTAESKCNNDEPQEAMSYFYMTHFDPRSWKA